MDFGFSNFIYVYIYTFVFRGFQQYVVHDGIVHVAVMRRVIFLRDVDVVVDHVYADRLKGFDRRAKILPPRDEADVAGDVLLKNVRNQDSFLRGQLLVHFLLEGGLLEERPLQMLDFPFEKKKRKRKTGNFDQIINF